MDGLRLEQWDHTAVITCTLARLFSKKRPQLADHHPYRERPRRISKAEFEEHSRDVGRRLPKTISPKKARKKLRQIYGE